MRFLSLAKLSAFMHSASLSFGSPYLYLHIFNTLKCSAMKSIGSVLAFTRERNTALLRAYRKEIAKVGSVHLSEIGERIVNSPSPRFWVSEERAAVVISAIMKGKPILKTMRPTKREMFEEIYRRIVELKKAHPDWKLCQLACAVVNSPAPKFYMEASSAIERLFKIRNGWYNKR